MIHELKIEKCYFVRVLSGEKTFEVRENDRHYKRGDLLALNEMEDGVHTGRSCLVRVDYVLDNPNYCKNGFVVMSIKPCFVLNKTAPYDACKMREDYSVPLATDNTGG